MDVLRDVQVLRRFVMTQPDLVCQGHSQLVFTKNSSPESIRSRTEASKVRHNTATLDALATSMLETRLLLNYVIVLYSPLLFQ